jgi:hypothetical protein
MEVRTMTWAEFKKLVKEAGVRDSDNVADLCITTNTDGCRCDLSDGGHPVTICWVPNEHFTRELTIAGREIEIPWETDEEQISILEKMARK